MPVEVIEKMEQEIVQQISGYFSFDGVLHQMELFLQNPLLSSLSCQPLPPHPGTNRNHWIEMMNK
jgi:hypothetical protein